MKKTLLIVSLLSIFSMPLKAVDWTSSIDSLIDPDTSYYGESGIIQELESIFVSYRDEKEKILHKKQSYNYQFDVLGKDVSQKIKQNKKFKNDVSLMKISFGKDNDERYVSTSVKLEDAFAYGIKLEKIKFDAGIEYGITLVFEPTTLKKFDVMANQIQRRFNKKIVLKRSQNEFGTSYDAGACEANLYREAKTGKTELSFMLC